MATFIPTGKWKRKGANLPKNVQIAKAKQGKVKVAGGKRTTHRSSTGSKLYAVRDADGTFKDVQTYKRAHAQDVKRRAKAEGYPDPPPVAQPHVTRFEVIDETGRVYVKYGVSVTLSYQDEGRTLKVFVEPREVGKQSIDRKAVAEAMERTGESIRRSGPTDGKFVLGREAFEKIAAVEQAGKRTGASKK